MSFEGLMDTTDVLSFEIEKDQAGVIVRTFEMLQQGVAQLARIRELMELRHALEMSERKKREPQWSAARHQIEPLSHIG